MARATRATHATLAALGVFFQAFPVLCPFEPRRPREEMQAVPRGSVRKGFLLYRDWVARATRATHAALAALGVFFQDFPVLCPFEPRRPREEMQAVPRGARSDTRLLPASTSQPPPVDIRSVRKYNTGVCRDVKVKTVLIISDMSSYPARKETPAHPHPDAFARASTSTHPRGGRAPVTLVCTHANEPRRDPC